jgi:hypothetical protein
MLLAGRKKKIVHIFFKFVLTDNFFFSFRQTSKSILKVKVEVKVKVEIEIEVEV